jgi:hypothetical protein
VRGVGVGWRSLPTSSDRDKPKRAITRSGNNSSKRAARMLADDSITNLREGWAEKVARLEADMDNTTSQLENLRLKQQRLQQTQQVRDAAAFTCSAELLERLWRMRRRTAGALSARLTQRRRSWILRHPTPELWKSCVSLTPESRAVGHGTAVTGGGGDQVRTGGG